MSTRHKPAAPDAQPPGPRFHRRAFLRLGSAAAAGLTFSRWPVVAGPFEAADFEKLVPADKKLDPAWVRSLSARGERTTYRWPESRFIGMPVGGLCAGQLYLGGDGTLWHWDIFNRHADTGSGGPHYAKPMEPASPLDQGFALTLTQAGKKTVRPLDHRGWRDVAFTGEYPVAFVEYRDPECPVSVSLEAFSPFIPLNTEDSALPATVMRFTLTNQGAEAIRGQLDGWLENAVCLYSAEPGGGRRRNQIVPGEKLVALECRAEATPAGPERKEKRPDVAFDDFERANWGDWTATGSAFGSGPVEQDKMPEYQGKVGAHGRRLVNSHASAPGTEVGARDAATGTLTSRRFVIERDFITFLIGGGSHAGRTCMNLLVDGRVVRSATGRNDNRLGPQSWNVRPWAGQFARLEIVDREQGPWGNIGVDDIVFTDTPATPEVPLANQPDFGTMTLALLRDGASGGTLATEGAHPDTQGDADRVYVGPTGGLDFAVAFHPFGEKLVGSLARAFTLAPGQSTTVTFLVTWHFPNLKLDGLEPHAGRHYGKRFAGATEVAQYVAENFDRLAGQTRLWHDTWYGSSLPHWFLERTFLNTSILATSTCFWLGNGRFYAWEGVGCCAGTCGHVWQYAQAVARLFPQLERTAREVNDYGIGFDPDTGRIRFRAEHNDIWAVDGQSGVILRTYREHQMSPDAAFLQRVWPKAKKALAFLINHDLGRDGLMDGPQHNTLDTDWFGHIAWLSGLYLSAVRAGEAMARELGDTDFAEQCRQIVARGRQHLGEELFNGEYFINRVDPAHLDAINSGTGCHIDQVMGDAWAGQVGLGRLLDATQVKSALRSLWRYNFTPDVGPWRQVNKPGRWYALAGEGGLLMCTFPHADWDYRKASGRGADWAAGYFNECMTGFEYQVAWHQLAEGFLTEGLAITRAIHDRYHASRRNPWNEIECGDHYARAMASYGVYLAACGFACHGPKGHLGFAPRLRPEDFSCAFTTAEGWGTFSQQLGSPNSRFDLHLRYGRLRLRTLDLTAGDAASLKTVTVQVGGQTQPATHTVEGRTVRLTLANETALNAGDHLTVTVD